MSRNLIPGRLLPTIVLAILLAVGWLPAVTGAVAQQGVVSIASVDAACGPEEGTVTVTVTVDTAERGQALRLALTGDEGPVADQWLLLNEFTDAYEVAFTLGAADEPVRGEVTAEITEAAIYPDQDPLETSPTLPITSNALTITDDGSCEAAAATPEAGTPIPFATPATEEEGTPAPYATPATEEEGTPLIILPETPTPTPTEEPSPTPTEEPTATPTEEPSPTPTEEPTATPTEEPTATPTEEPTATPTEEPTATPTEEPTATPTEEPTATPTEEPTATPTEEPTATPTEEPTATPTEEPTATPTEAPTATPEPTATEAPTATPEPTATEAPTATPEPTATEAPTATTEPTATPTEAPTATTEPTPSPTPPPVGVVANTGGIVLNCRAEPNLGADILTILAPGTQVEIRGETENGWVPVRCGDQDGWVDARFLEIDAEATPAGTIVTVVTNGSSAPCRVEPNDEAEIITLIANGDFVTARGAVEDGWVPVTCDDTDGWVDDELVEP